MSTELEFKIDAWTPATIPQARLGQYLIELAKLYGESESVRFLKLRKGSAVLVSLVADHARPKVERRLYEIRTGSAVKDAVEAFQRIDDMLALDNATAVVRGLENGRVVQFPGRERPKPIDYGAIREDGFIEGEIVRIGGRDQSVHITLQDGDTTYTTIETNRDMARRLGPLIFGPTVRLWGNATWRRGPTDGWQLERFVVASFEEVSASLYDVIDSLQAIGGSKWGDETDPTKSLLNLRHGQPDNKNRPRKP